MGGGVEAACAAWRLAWPRQMLRGHAGARLGTGTGSSVEFMDHRDYVPGDDLRHLDWRAYARTDRLNVRLFREEVAPALDLVLDLSPSVFVTEAKARTLDDLVLAYRHWCRAAGVRARVLAAAGEEIPEGKPLAEGAIPRGALLPRALLRARSLRVVVSDFLFPEDPAGELRQLARGAVQLDMIHLLDPWEADPRADGALTLVDAETGERLDLRLDDAAREVYGARLARLRAGVAAAARTLGARLALAVAAPAAAVFRNALLPAGLIEPGP